MKLWYIFLITGIGIAGALVMIWAFIELIGISFKPYTKTEQKCNEYVAFACNSNNQLPNEPKTQNPPSGDNVKVIWQGEEVARGHLPHMALIHSKVKGTICGGSLISENFLITAAHCCRKIQIEGAKIVLGTVTLSGDEEFSQSFFTNEVYFYPGPTGRVPDDICLVKLPTAVQFTAYVRPICLNVRTNVELKGLTSSGWGRDSSGGVSRELKSVNLEPFPDSECNTDYPNTYNSTTYICAGSSKVYDDVCEGDSGGPLQMPHKTSPCRHIYHLVGVVSRGMPCRATESTKAFGTFAKVAFYIPWIEKTVWP